MPYSVYKVVHLSGLFFMILSLGMMMAGRPNKITGIIHGVATVISLIGGFGLLARLGLHGGWPVWVWLKIFTWLILAMAPLFYKRLAFLSKIYSLCILTLLVFTIYTVVYKPF